MPNLPRRLVCEALGTALLLAAVVGSGIMAQRLSGGNNALALLCNTLPTGAMLTVLILVFGPLSGAFQSGGQRRLGAAAGIAVDERSGLHRRADRRRPGRRVDGASDVRIAGVAGVLDPAHRHRTVARRAGRDLRIAADDLRLRRADADRPALRRRALHHRGLLVHRIDVVCQSGRDRGAGLVRHLCRHRTFGGTRFYPGPIGWDAAGHGAGPMALAGLPSLLRANHTSPLTF